MKICTYPSQTANLLADPTDTVGHTLHALDDSDEEDDRHAAPKRKGQAGGVRLRADNDNPMDLLSGASKSLR